MLPVLLATKTQIIETWKMLFWTFFGALLHMLVNKAMEKKVLNMKFEVFLSFPKLPC